MDGWMIDLAPQKQKHTEACSYGTCILGIGEMVTLNLWCECVLIIVLLYAYKTVLVSCEAGRADININ